MAGDGALTEFYDSPVFGQYLVEVSINFTLIHQSGAPASSSRSGDHRQFEYSGKVLYIDLSAPNGVHTIKCCEGDGEASQSVARTHHHHQCGV